MDATDGEGLNGAVSELVKVSSETVEGPGDELVVMLVVGGGKPKQSVTLTILKVGNCSSWYDGRGGQPYTPCRSHLQGIPCTAFPQVCMRAASLALSRPNHMSFPVDEI